MKYLKEKIFKFKKWLIGFLIPIAIAVPLAALPPDTTEYRFVLSRANDYFDCSSFSENERELCNKKKAEENFIKYPEYYKDYFENLVPADLWKKLDGEFPLEELHQQIVRILKEKQLI